MIAKIHRICYRWNHFKLSPASKIVLINSSLLSIPTYYLSVYPIPDFVLTKISKVVNSFLWEKKVAMKMASMLLLGLVLLKVKLCVGALVSEISLLLNILLRQKLFSSIWTLMMLFGIDLAPSNGSWFFQGLCNSAALLKSFY